MSEDKGSDANAGSTQEPVSLTLHKAIRSTHEFLDRTITTARVRHIQATRGSGKCLIFGFFQSLTKAWLDTELRFHTGAFSFG